MSMLADAVPATKEVIATRKLVAATIPQSSKIVVKNQALISHDIADFLSIELESPKPIVGEWLVERCLVLLHAWRGVGKTWFVLSLAFAISSGSKFLKWEVRKPRRVLLIDGEMQASAMQQRLAHIVGMSDKEPAAGYLTILTPDLQLDRGMPDISTLEGQFEIDEIISAKEIDLIIVDNLSCLARTGRENESESWQSVAQWALKMRREGRSVLFVHHDGKNGQQRGNSKKEDILDVVIALKRPAEYDPSKGAHFEIHFEKARHSSGDEITPQDVKLITNNCGKLQWQFKDAADGRNERIKELKEDGLSYSEIAAELGIAKSTVCRALKGNSK